MMKKICSLILVIFLFTLNALGENSYKNELTKVGFSTLGTNDVKITLYTSKPYSEPLRLLKKNDSEFVLILPETYTSAPQKPSISDVIGEVTDVDVRLYSFVSNANENGYTKIVIKTNGLINLYPETVTTGGGKLVNREINKIVASKIKPAQQTPHIDVIKPTSSQQNQEPTSQNTYKKPILQNIQIPTKEKTVSKPKESFRETVNKKIEKVIKNKENQTAKKSAQKVLPVQQAKLKSDNKNDTDVKKEEVKSDIKDEIVETSQPTAVVPENLPEESLTVVENQEKSINSEEKPKSENKAPSKKSLIILALLLLIGYRLLGTKKNIKSENIAEENVEVINETTTADNENKGEYSDFFRTLIESEVKGENAFQLNEYNASNIEEELTTKSHREVMDIDQNLSWQEKFRAVQRNKKALLKDEDNELNDNNLNENEHIKLSETNENMHIENPLKKLQQDFKAVRKVLERQSKNSNSIEQKFPTEKIEQVEVISFEDYQKQTEPPKVQIKATVPIKSNPPKIVSQLPLKDDRGLYLIDYNEKIALVGYIKDKVFKLSTYPDLKNTRLYARLSDTVNGKDTYIVKFDDKKMLVDISEDEMLLKLTY